MLAVDVGLSEMLEFEASPDGVALQVCAEAVEVSSCAQLDVFGKLLRYESMSRHNPTRSA